MLQEFRRMPEPLQKQILIRLGFGASSLVLLIAFIVSRQGIYIWLPCAGMMIFSAVAAFSLFRRAVLGEYVVIDGECTKIETTPAKRRAKYIILQTDICQVKVMLRNRLKRISVGATVEVYVAKNTPIYDHNGSQMLYTYIAVDVK